MEMILIWEGMSPLHSEQGGYRGRIQRPFPSNRWRGQVGKQSSADKEPEFEKAEARRACQYPGKIPSLESGTEGGGWGVGLVMVAESPADIS